MNHRVTFWGTDAKLGSGKGVGQMDAKRTGALIARRRKELGLSQVELAERIHVTDKAVSRWETGRGMPAVDSLEPLAEVLGLSVSELLSGQELTPAELPKAAGGQIVESMRKNARMLWKGILIAVIVLAAVTALTAGAYVGYHYAVTMDGEDFIGLAQAAAEYLDAGELEVVLTQQRGDYLAALLRGENGRWCMCVYDRDNVFPDRWYANGGKRELEAGKLGSWNYGSPREGAVIIICGGGLPEKAARYIFRNSGTVYLRPAGEQVLDIFLIPGTEDINGTPVLLDENLQALEEGWPQWVEDMLQFN